MVLEEAYHPGKVTYRILHLYSLYTPCSVQVLVMEELSGLYCFHSNWEKNELWSGDQVRSVNILVRIIFFFFFDESHNLKWLSFWNYIFQTLFIVLLQPNVFSLLLHESKDKYYWGLQDQRLTEMCACFLPPPPDTKSNYCKMNWVQLFQVNIFS